MNAFNIDPNAQDFLDKHDTATPKNKKPRASKSISTYEPCRETFIFRLDAVGDLFLHLQRIIGSRKHLKLVFDVQSQHLTIVFGGESLSDIWRDLTISTRPVTKVETPSFVLLNHLIRIHHLNQDGIEWILEIRLAKEERK